MQRNQEGVPLTAIAWRSMLVALAFAATTMYLSVASRAEELPPREPLAGVPMAVDEWRGRRDTDLTPDVLAILGVDDYIVRYYARGDMAPIGLYIGYHASQRQGDTIHSPLNCLPGAGWEPIDVGRIRIPVQTPADPSLGAIDANRVIIAKGNQHLVQYDIVQHFESGLSQSCRESRCMQTATFHQFRDSAAAQ